MNRRLTDQSGVETFVVWTTMPHWNAASVANRTWLLLQGWELKEETTFDLDAAAVPIGHGETTTVASVHLGLKTPGRLAGARRWGYGPETCYNRALMLATPDDASYCRRCSPLKLLNLDYIQHFSYGARGFMRVPVSEANDLNYLLEIFATQLFWIWDSACFGDVNYFIFLEL